jgi:hypothetical protein
MAAHHRHQRYDKKVIAGVQELFDRSTIRNHALPRGAREDHMRTGTDVCGPDQLKILQQIFDSVWQQVKLDPNFHIVEEEELRLQVSQRVMAYAERDLLDINGIKYRVLRSFAKSSTVTEADRPADP